MKFWAIMPCRFFSRFSLANDTRKDQKVPRTHCSINFCSLLQREMQEAIQTRNTALCQKVQKVSLHSDFTNRRHSMWKVYLSVIWYSCNLVTSIIYIRTFHSLRSKRFRLVSEQRKTEERDSRFWPREKWNKSQKMKVGGGGGEGRNINAVHTRRNVCRSHPKTRDPSTFFFFNFLHGKSPSTVDTTRKSALKLKF